MTLVAHKSNLRADQRGAILIAVLAILITLTILGLAGMRSTTLEERMAGNFQEKYLAFQAAEAAARDGEAVLNNETTRAALVFAAAGITPTNGAYDVTAADGSTDPFDTFTGTAGANYIEVTVDGQASGTAYYIEQLPEKDLSFSSLVVGFPSTTPTIQMYRVTARGYGLTGQTEVIVQTTWAL